MFVMTCEELSQMIASGISNWWNEHWNKFDAALYLTFWIGFSLKWESTAYGNRCDPSVGTEFWLRTVGGHNIGSTPYGALSIALVLGLK